jgi:ABC-type multidrug transport system fused ATPase/permease subunit
LDEPTSALDTHSEMQVLEALNRVMKDRSVLIVAHRLSTIKEVDEILVMDDGRVVERGTHEQLINTEGVYKQLYLRQFASKDENIAS